MIDRFSTFMTAITQISRSIQSIKCREMAAFGLKGTHVMCLFHLQQHPEGLTAARLASLCLEDKAAVSRSLGDLERRGLASFADVEGRKRYRTQITLTDEGRQVCDRMDAVIRELVERGGRGYSEVERKIFYRVLLQIAENLQEAGREEELSAGPRRP